MIKYNADFVFSKLLKINVWMYCFFSWFYLYDFRVFWVVLPVLPGPTLSWVGLPLVLTVAVPANYWVLGTTLLINYFCFRFCNPSQRHKKFGGSSYGVWGTTIGLIVGILAQSLLASLLDLLLAH
jgi:uncharacterized protein YqgC (DUF456 family)